MIMFNESHATALPLDEETLVDIFGNAVVLGIYNEFRKIHIQEFLACATSHGDTNEMQENIRSRLDRYLQEQETPKQFFCQVLTDADQYSIQIFEK